MKLQKHVYGYEFSGNDFVFDQYLDQKLPVLLSRHTRQSPTLIFCFTRKSCETTAAKLSEWWSSLANDTKPWRAAQDESRCPMLNYRKPFNSVSPFTMLDSIPLIAEPSRRASCTVKYLSFVVHLRWLLALISPARQLSSKEPPASLDNRLQELSDLRSYANARTCGTAAVRRQRYRHHSHALIQQGSIREAGRWRGATRKYASSQPHTSISTRKSALGRSTAWGQPKVGSVAPFSTYACSRIQSHYQLTDPLFTTDRTADILGKICEANLRLLSETNLITGGRKFRPTDYGWAMSKYMVKFGTMRMILDIPARASIETIASPYMSSQKHGVLTPCRQLNSLCQSSEFRDLRLRLYRTVSFSRDEQTCSGPLSFKGGDSSMAQSITHGSSPTRCRSVPRYRQDSKYEEAASVREESRDRCPAAPHSQCHRVQRGRS